MSKNNMNGIPELMSPDVLRLKNLEEEGVIVFDYIPKPMLMGESCITRHLIVSLWHQGSAIYEAMPNYQLNAPDVAVLMPRQFVPPMKMSSDIRCTNIAVSNNLYEQLLLEFPYPRRASLFRRQPICRLTEQQYKAVLDAVTLMRTVSQIESQFRTKRILYLLGILLNIIGDFDGENHPNEKICDDSHFSRFYESLIQNHRTQHEIGFYAEECCLSPKHFSTVIKAETGIRPSDWISTYIAIRAKMLLNSRKDFTVKEICHHLGFSDQASFARFFKKHTGMTPTEYRNEAKPQSDGMKAKIKAPLKQKTS